LRLCLLAEPLPSNESTFHNICTDGSLTGKNENGEGIYAIC
jgi:hypothetical protein